MRIVNLPANFVKFSIRSKQSSLLAVAAVIVMVILLAVPIFFAKRSSAHGVNFAKTKRQGCCGEQPAILRRMTGTYYTTEGGFKSTLILNNKGPNQIVVNPVLHGQNGQTFTASPVAVGGQSSSEVDLNVLASIAGPKFRAGSFEFTYEGRLLEIGGGLRIIDSEKSLIFDEQMLEPGMKFPSSQLEAVYAVPFEDSQVSVIVTNTTAQPIAVDGESIFARDHGQHPVKVQLGPYETRVVNLPHGLVKKASAGAVSLSHNGGKGALLAMIHLQDAGRGYSEAVNFTNPTGGKTNERHGAGLRLGRINNESLKPVIVVRNLGNSATTVTATVPYSKQNGDTGTIALPQLSLAPGEIELLNMSNPQLMRNDFATAGLEIEYTGAPGSVIASAASVSQSGNHVFALPLKDPQGGMSSTGGYPWFINEKGSTVVFIKNTTEKPQKFHLDVVHSGGRWGSNLRTLAPGQTFALDVRAVRDSQEKGSGGNAIPLDVTVGHVSWSVYGVATNKTLIGRAQTVDFTKAIASTYECQCPCNATYSNARLVPSSVTGVPGDTQQFLPQQQNTDCLGNPTEWFDVFGVSFSSDNPSVATINTSGLGTAQESGTTNIRASWTASIISYEGDPLMCESFDTTADCSASCVVYRITGMSPSVRHVSTGDNPQAHTISVSFEPSNGYAGIIFQSTFDSNVGGTANATLTIPVSNGQGSASTTIQAGAAGSSEVFIVRPRFDFSSQLAPYQTSVIVPPQILIQMLRSEASGLPDNGVRDLLGVSMKNRFGDSTYFANQNTYAAAIMAGAAYNTSITTGVQPELSAAARVFGSTFDPSSGCQGFWTPTAAQWNTVNQALLNPTTTLPSGTGIPFNYNGHPEITQIVYFPIVGGNPPSFLFVRKRTSNQNSVVQINLP